MRKALQIAAGVAAAVLAIAGGAAAGLAFPGTPRSTASLGFAGFVHLPDAEGSGPLSVLDYLTVHDRSLFVASIKPGAVYRVPLTDGPLPEASDIAVLAGRPSAHGVAFDPTSRLGFISRSGAGSAPSTVDVFDPGTMQFVGHAPVAPGVDAILFDPASRLVYAASGGLGLATLIDPARQTEAWTISLGGSPEFAVADPAAGLIYQNLEDQDAVAVVDVSKHQVVDRWPLTGCEGPTGIALDAARQRMFAVCKGNAVLTVLDLHSHKVIQTLGVAGWPDSVAYDPGPRRIYATGRTGTLNVVQQEGADAYRLLDTIHLHLGAHTLTVDPISHRVWIGYASLLSAPRLAVFDARP